MDILNLILRILLLIMAVIQIIVLIQMFYTTHKRYKDDTKFWDDMHTKMMNSYDNLGKKLKENTESEQNQNK